MTNVICEGPSLFGKHLKFCSSMFHQFSHHTHMCLTNIFCLCQASVLVNQCLSWWPNRQLNLTNIAWPTFWNLLAKYACAWPHLNKHWMAGTLCWSMFIKLLKLVTSKKCLSSTWLCDWQNDQRCVWQRKLQILVKQHMFLWQGLNPILPGVFGTTLEVFCL